MSFQYPDGWTVNEMNGTQTVNLTKSSDWIRVLLIGTAKSSNGLNKYLDEGITLGNMYKSQGYYHDNITNQSYQVFTGDVNNQHITYYLFTKNGKYYEIRETGDLDAYDKIMETIN